MARTKREVEPEHPEDYRDPKCPRCDAAHYSILGFTFPGDWRAEALLALMSSQPELIDRFENEENAN